MLPNAVLMSNAPEKIDQVYGIENLERMADYILDEFRRWRDGKPLLYQVRQEDFEKRA